MTSAWANAFAAYEAPSLEERYRLDVPRDPRAIAVTEDGARAFVSHSVGGSYGWIGRERTQAF